MGARTLTIAMFATALLAGCAVQATDEFEEERVGSAESELGELVEVDGVILTVDPEGRADGQLENVPDQEPSPNPWHGTPASELEIEDGDMDPVPGFGDPYPDP